MRIAHICLSCFYIDGFAYQENELVRRHVEDGHEVTVIASTESFGDDRRLTYVESSTYLGRDGARVIRLPYHSFLPQRIMRKLRMHPGVLKHLECIRPEVILFHGLCGWEMRAMARYKKKNPQVRLLADSHEDAYNSARNFLSRHVLHRLYYAWIIRRCLPAIEKVLCVSLETMDFVHTTYGVPRDRLEFFPLGGRVFDDVEYQSRRMRGRVAAGVSDDQVMLLQTGKMGERKKVLQSLRAFVTTAGSHMRLVLAGSFDETVRDQALALITTDSRIRFMGWQSPEKLADLLCGADVYVQPGTQSATMQMSLCARCAVVLDDVRSHQPYFDRNGWLLRSDADLTAAFSELAAHSKTELVAMGGRSGAVAARLLDYRRLADRVVS